MPRRRVCFVTGTRAEYGLMRSTLRAIEADRKLELQIIATGTHLSPAHGRTIRQIHQDGFAVNEAIAWPERSGLAGDTLTAGTRIAAALRKLDPQIVLVVGDRVEAFTAATAAHLDGRIVAHVHGGDRALGQCDDTLRHTITKLAHLHFPATRASARRILRLGERREHVFCVGTPGLDDLPVRLRRRRDRKKFAVAVLHPEGPSEGIAARQARMMLRAIQQAGVPALVLIDPNNDPGWQGIARVYRSLRLPGISGVKNLDRDTYLATLADAGLLIGNSSSGIIEAASLGLRVVNIGKRQAGRERSANVTDVPWDRASLIRAIRQHFGKPYRGQNVYGGGGAGKKIAAVLSDVPLTQALGQKLICY